jgi:hypothetical protein
MPYCCHTEEVQVLLKYQQYLTRGEEKKFKTMDGRESTKMLVF